jgi:MSHA biogenesis protein MshQ
VVPPASTSLSFSTSTGTGTWQAGTVAGSGTWTPSGANNGLATYIWPGSETSVRVRLRQTTAATININLVDSGARVESVTEDPSIAFVDTGFLFAASAGGAAATIANQVAGTASGTYYLRAVRTSTTTQACEAALQGPNTVNFGYECNNPTTCAPSNLMSVDGGTPTTIARNDNGSVSAYASVPMTFDANGNAPFTFNFLDVGQAKLHAAKDVSGASLAGASSAFVARPAGFGVTGIQTTVGGVPNPGAVDAAGAAFIKAGDDITLTVNALNSLGNLTPNFGRETTAEGVRLEQALVAGLGLTANPALGNGTIAGGAFTAGAATVSNVTWGEVGIIRLTPRVADGNYLGAGDVVGTQTGNVGRFTPFDFNASANSPSFTTGCAAGSFSYVGQPFVYGTAPVLSVTARNKAGVTTQNYKGTAPAASAFFKLTNATLTPNSQAARYSAASGTLDTAALPGLGSDPTIADNGNGTATLTFSSTGGIAFDRTVPVTPFDADVALSINVVDADNVAFAGNPAKFGDASPGSGIAFSAGKAMRFGRLLLQNAYGPETLALRVPMEIQYWNGTGFVRNAGDACTTLNREHVGLSGYTVNLAACETAVGEAAVAFSGGQAVITLAAAGAGNTGSVQLTPVLGALGAEMYCPAKGAAEAAASSAGRAYLRGKWTGATWDENPAARAAFGLYGSQPKNFIFFRENY